MVGDEVEGHMVVVGKILQESGVAQHDTAPHLYHIPVVVHLLPGIAQRMTAPIARQRLVVVGCDGGVEAADRGGYWSNRANWANRVGCFLEGFLTAAFAGTGVDALAAVYDR